MDCTVFNLIYIEYGLSEFVESFLVNFKNIIALKSQKDSTIF